MSFFGQVQRVVQLAEFFDNDDDVLPCRGSRKSELDKIAVLKPVQYKQTVFCLFQPECSIKLGLRTCFEPEVVPRSLAQVFLQDRPVRVDLHRKNAKMAALVLELLYRFAKCS